VSNKDYKITKAVASLTQSPSYDSTENYIKHKRLYNVPLMFEKHIDSFKQDIRKTVAILALLLLHCKLPQKRKGKGKKQGNRKKEWVELKFMGQGKEVCAK